VLCPRLSSTVSNVRTVHTRDTVQRLVLSVTVLSDVGDSMRRVLAALDDAVVTVRTPSAAVALQKQEHGDAVVAVCAGVGPDELESLRSLADETDTDIVVVAGDRNRRAIRDALGAGARGYVAVEHLEERLMPTLRAVCAGQLAIPAEMGHQMGRPRLSPREKQIMAMVVMGFTNREIANKLYLAETTVKSHLSSAFEKLGVRSRQEATALILDSNDGLGTGILKITEERSESAFAVGER
jgi:DNA-binding NarL/FixJ family response regulator